LCRKRRSAKLRRHGVARLKRLTFGGIALAATAVFAAAPSAAHNCKCRHAGQSYELGQIVCIRGKVARCEMVLNNSSWNMLADTCPESAAPRTLLAQLSPPVAAAH
jgi:hypothetical protein